MLNTHDIARHTEPDARVAYVDNDPIVISHARSLLAKSPGVIAVPGDIRDPGHILADPGLTGLIDLAEPVCVIMSGVLHFADPATARDIAAAFVRAIAPRSYLIISVGSGNPSEGELHLGVHRRADLHPLAGRDPGFLRRPGAGTAGRGLGARLVRRRPGPEPGAAHGDVRGGRGPQGDRRVRPPGPARTRSLSSMPSMSRPGG